MAAESKDMETIVEMLKQIQQGQNQVLMAVDSISHHSPNLGLRAPSISAGMDTPTATGTPPLLPSDTATEQSGTSSPPSSLKSAFSSRIVLTWVDDFPRFPQGHVLVLAALVQKALTARKGRTPSRSASTRCP